MRCSFYLTMGLCKSPCPKKISSYDPRLTKYKQNSPAIEMMWTLYRVVVYRSLICFNWWCWKKPHHVTTKMLEQLGTLKINDVNKNKGGNNNGFTESWFIILESVYYRGKKICEGKHFGVRPYFCYNGGKKLEEKNEKKFDSFSIAKCLIKNSQKNRRKICVISVWLINLICAACAGGKLYLCSFSMCFLCVYLCSFSCGVGREGRIRF